MIQDAALPAPGFPTGSGPHDRPMVEVSGLSVDIKTESGTFTAIKDVDLHIQRNEVLGLVGESGSGKSITASALMRMLPTAASVTGGSIRFDEHDMLTVSERHLCSIRGSRIGMIFQDPLTSLNPVVTIGAQLVEAIRLHDKSVGKQQALGRSEELLKTVGIPAAGQRLRSYPHELSGGMRQRVMIAMAISNDPDLLIADEPTTALDVTTQAQVLDALALARETTHSALLLITHDLGVIADHADRVAVMYNGRIVETGDTAEVLGSPQHPYTVGLMRCRPSLSARIKLVPIPGSPPRPNEADVGCAFAARCGRSQGRSECRTTVPLLSHRPSPAGEQVPVDHLAACHFADELPPPLEVVHAADRPDTSTVEPTLVVRELSKNFPLRRKGLRKQPGAVHAASGVSLDLTPGRTTALVGESGSGKSTTARAILRLIEPTTASIEFAGQDVMRFGPGRLRDFRTDATIVFQDPYSSLNPRKTIHEAIAEPMRIHGLLGRGEKAKVGELLQAVGLHPEYAARFPHEFSGGQRQRICIARAIGVEPKVLVLDEPVSALDVSVQAQILTLLDTLQRERAMAYLLITHDLAVVRNIADDVAIMYLGNIVEYGPADQIFNRPAHPYSKVLMQAVPGWQPGANETRVSLQGDPPDPANPPPGCPFHDRCFKAQDLCRLEKPPLQLSPVPSDRRNFACHFPEGL
ncbi:dipeptide ABC transporter ATP-binding protein [Kribbella sp. CA-245084]|uniref:ABC transporter ATP-binding protein n=1 Tax=Kribbella sp. CA-245084 TaxID=3239940 RepID=UPI003D8B5498